MKNFFDNIKLLIDDLFYETKETVKNKEFYFLRENSKNSGKQEPRSKPCLTSLIVLTARQASFSDLTIFRTAMNKT